MYIGKFLSNLPPVDSTTDSQTEDSNSGDNLDGSFYHDRDGDTISGSISNTVSTSSSAAYFDYHEEDEDDEVEEGGGEGGVRHVYPQGEPSEQNRGRTRTRQSSHLASMNVNIPSLSSTGQNADSWFRIEPSPRGTSVTPREDEEGE